MSSLKQQAINSVNAAKARVEHQPEYNLPWRVQVHFSTGYNFTLTHTATRRRAREVAAEWNGRSPCKVASELLVEAYRLGAD